MWSCLPKGQGGIQVFFRAPRVEDNRLPNGLTLKLIEHNMYI